LLMPGCCCLLHLNDAMATKTTFPVSMPSMTLWKVSFRRRAARAVIGGSQHLALL
jgi:hypothetical protein